MLESSIMSEYVMLNLVLNSFQYRFSISTKSANYETLNSLDPESSSGPGSGRQITTSSATCWVGEALASHRKGDLPSPKRFVQAG